MYHIVNKKQQKIYKYLKKYRSVHHQSMDRLVCNTFKYFKYYGFQFFW
jgi:hypothetical protein